MTEDAARFLSALQAEVREAGRELRAVVFARWRRSLLSLEESLLGLLAGLIGLGTLLTTAIVGVLALAHGLHDGLLVWTARPWLAETIEGLLLLALVASARPFLRWSIGRRALRRVRRAERARRQGAVPRGDERGSTKDAA